MFRNLANFPLVHIRDFDQFVDQEIVIAGFQDVLDYGSDAVPLFVAGQAALAEDNQTCAAATARTPLSPSLPTKDGETCSSSNMRINGGHRAPFRFASAFSAF